MEKFPQLNNLIIQLNIFLQHCNECFQKRRNRKLDHHTFLSRNQRPSEFLHQKDNPLHALQFAIAFEDGLKRQKTYGYYQSRS